ncbi:MAG: DUF1801 domain-containing protein [Bacteroidota bacterium]
MNVDVYIADIEPPEIRELVKNLRTFIEATIPQVTVEIKWKVPYFSYCGLLCYINPHPDKASIGFARGTSLSNQQGILAGQRELKVVRYIYFYPGESLPEQGLTEILLEAAMLNELR